MPTIQSADYQEAVDAIIADYGFELQQMLADLKKGGLQIKDVSMMGLNDRLHNQTGYTVPFIGTTRQALEQLEAQA